MKRRSTDLAATSSADWRDGAKRRRARGPDLRVADPAATKPPRPAQSPDGLMDRVLALGTVKGRFAIKYLPVSLPLKSRRTDYVFDGFQVTSNPRLLREVCRRLAALIPREARFLAGVALAGIPWVTLLSQITGRPALFVRMQAKHHGTRRVIEGNQDFVGQAVCLVDEILVTGKTLACAREQLRQQGAVPQWAVFLAVSETEGLRAVRRMGMKARYLFDWRDGRMRQETLQVCRCLKRRLRQARRNPRPPMPAAKETSPAFLLGMCREIEAHYLTWPVDKLHRWIGYIQGVLVATGYSTVKAERGMIRLVRRKTHARPD